MREPRQRVPIRRMNSFERPAHPVPGQAALNHGVSAHIVGVIKFDEFVVRHGPEGGQSRGGQKKRNQERAPTLLYEIHRAQKSCTLQQVTATFTGINCSKRQGGVPPRPYRGSNMWSLWRVESAPTDFTFGFPGRSPRATGTTLAARSQG